MTDPTKARPASSDEPGHEPQTRREAAAARRPDRHWAAIALGVCVVTILGLLLAFLRPGGGEDPGGQAASRGPGGRECDAPTRVRVVTTTEMQPVVDQVAGSVGSDGCVVYDVTAETPDKTLATFGDTAKRPHLWIPDTTAHLLRAQSRFPALQLTGSTAFAASPLLAAVPKAQAPDGALGWNDVFAKPERVHLADPMTNSAGLLTLISTGVRPSSTPTATATTGPMGVALHQVAHGIAPRPRALPADGATAQGVYVVSEQQLARFVRESPGTDLVAVPLSDPSVPLDYRAVPVPTTDAQIASAVATLASHLEVQAAAEQVRAAGFRVPGDTEGPALPTRAGTGSVALRTSPLPGSQAVRAAILQWKSVSTGMRLLAIIDTSGSMKKPAGPSTRIQLAAEAAAGGAMSLTPNTEVGLWEFSTGRGKKGAWRELAPVAPLIDAKGKPAHRDALIRAAQSLPARVGGDTPLYDTILAGVQRMHDDYDPTRINAVIVMTDGRNDVPGGIDFASLKSSLELQNVPGREVALAAIAIGPDADRRVLEDLAKATDGNYFSADDPTDIGRIVTAALMNFAPTSPESAPMP